MNAKRKNFFLVDNSIFTYRLKPRDIAVYCCVCMHVNTETGVAYILAYFESEEGKKEFAEWKNRKKRMQKQKTAKRKASLFSHVGR